ncbi:MAG: serine O-acetyltransferase [Thermodesulfobacteriota bacterium]
MEGAEQHSPKVTLDQHFCRSISEAFVYDQYRRCSGEFRFRRLHEYFYYLIVQPAYCAIVLFRIQQYLYSKAQKSRPGEKTVLGNFRFRFYDFMEKLTARLNFILNGGFEANHNADVRPGLFIHHPQAIIIGGNTKIGANCHLFKNVLFGVKNDGYPTIKDNVVIYANSVVLGGITVHNNAVIAPNSVVINDVERSTIVAGVPAKPIGINDHVFIQKDGVPIWLHRSSQIPPDSA